MWCPSRWSYKLVWCIWFQRCSVLLHHSYSKSPLTLLLGGTCCSQYLLSFPQNVSLLSHQICLTRSIQSWSFSSYCSGFNSLWTFMKREQWIYYNMALVNHIDSGQSGVKGVLAGFISHSIDTHLGFSLDYCVGQIRCIFTLPSTASNVVHWQETFTIEWFTPFATLCPEWDHGLYKISKYQIHGKQQASIILIELIQQSVHLFPAFGPVAPVEWKSRWSRASNLWWFTKIYRL